ncbi:hypothetical protein ACQEVI_18580 [Promicromonospora sp. CA-289599]|uniref:hypothetical protein n=1 Tax=Promicromonospora sp. CA-289599 TaxID=3240014 RepID=UPI003D8AB765
MTERDSCSHVGLDGRRMVVELSDGDLARLTAIAHRRGIDGPELVLEWIRRGMSNRIWAEPDERHALPDRVARDVEVARRSEDLFRDLLGGPADPD